MTGGRPFGAPVLDRAVHNRLALEVGWDENDWDDAIRNKGLNLPHVRLFFCLIDIATVL